MREEDKSQLIAEVCEALQREAPDQATNLLQRKYPFVPPVVVSRHYTNHETMRLFVRDGFIDRYSGQRLVFTPVLRILSLRLPDVFPFHSNWKMTHCHIAYWDLAPTLDHVQPIARGGHDDESNWVTTSQRRNSAKSNWTLAELEWQIHEPGDFRQWDGMVHWFLTYVASHPALQSSPYFRDWTRIAQRAITEVLP